MRPSIARSTISAASVAAASESWAYSSAVNALEAWPRARLTTSNPRACGQHDLGVVVASAVEPDRRYTRHLLESFPPFEQRVGVDEGAAPTGGAPTSGPCS
jgi:hypothetical protein